MPRLHITFMCLFERVKRDMIKWTSTRIQTTLCKTNLFASELLHNYAAERVFLFLCYSIIQSWHGYWFSSPNNNTEWLGLDGFGGSMELLIIVRWGTFSQNTWKSGNHEFITNTLMPIFFSCDCNWAKQAIHVSCWIFKNFLCFWFYSQAESCISA